ncbi:MAG: hypothetical protein WA941_14635 [Nitrososphaeraceae archaeon]
MTIFLSIYTMLDRVYYTRALLGVIAGVTAGLVIIPGTDQGEAKASRKFLKYQKEKRNVLASMQLLRV